MADEDENDLELILASLILTYQESLLKGVTKATIEAYVKAAQDLNIARIKAGLEALPIDEKQLTEDALKQVESWYSNLVKKGGSNVVVDHERLEFKPWLTDLKDEIEAELQDLYDNVEFTDEIDDIISDLETKFYERAELAAFYEIYRNADEAKRFVWEDLTVIRYAHEPNICHYCQELDGQTFPTTYYPPVPSHAFCKCTYEVIY